jgi:Protein of unknown function (DUF1553)/Protein of unknown function (DUF1549)/Planctomycete cytochrome C
MTEARRLCISLALAGCIGSISARAHAGLTFERDVRPILKEYCLDCHGGGESIKGKLDLRLKRFIERGGKSGPAIVAGKPEESYLLVRLKEGDMPPGEKKVPPEKIAVIERWVAGGAATLRREPERLSPGADITPEERAHWAFQPIRRGDPPAFRTPARVRTPIDAFVLARLRTRGLMFAPEADKRTLIRRAAFDLTGLMPSLREIDEFLLDARADAYEQMIDRLLASPAYGERWARHWLDAAGYAESDGNGTDDTVRPYAYKYRDYVVRSLSADKSLDRFITEQLAGDELAPGPWNNLTGTQIELLAATGFLRMAADSTSTGGGDEALGGNQVVADTLKIVGSALLGLTVGCAQCHDHRYDPISQSDYYRLRAVFEPALDPQHWRRPVQRLVSLYTDLDRAKAAAIDAEALRLQKEVDAKTQKYVAAALEKELLKVSEPQRNKLRAALAAPLEKRTLEQAKLVDTHPSLNISAGILYQYNQAAADELKKDQERVNAKRAEKPVEDFVSVLNELPGPRPETHVFHRGDHRQPGPAVKPADLRIAAPEGERFEIADADPKASSSGRRLAYARQLVTGKHPLVGRVLANRVWLNHFGRGLVETPADFGALGARPTHPDLLDWLADELVRQGWSLKRLHKLIMTSTVYRQSSRRDPAKEAVDSENTLLGRFPLRRVDAESLRDRILQVSGRLDRTLFGPPVPVVENSVGLVDPADDSSRRSLYIQVLRTKPVSLLATFDAPVMTVNCDRRIPSTTPSQSLMLMNNDFVLNHAARLARRLRALTEHQVRDGSRPLLAQQIACAWRLVYQRPITADELSWTRAFAAEQLQALERSGAGGDQELSMLTNLCQQLLNSNEFLYVD